MKNAFLVSLYGFILLIVLLNLRKINKKVINPIILTSMILIVFSINSENSKLISYKMIDIGQGDSFLLKDKDDYYLIDVGGPKYENYDSGKSILIPYLNSLGISKIKAIFISHEDNDHSGNLSEVYKNFEVENLYTDSLNLDTLKMYNPKIMKKKDRINLSRGYIECVYEGDSLDENSNSLGLIINIDNIKILTLGDLPKEFEDQLNVKADILKLSHHGSKTSSSKEFIDKVDPKIVLISAGRNNRYGHPHKEVLENVGRRLIYNTQNDGEVSIYFNKNLEIQPYLKGGYFKWNM